MKHFKVTTYQTSGLPIIENGTVLDVMHGPDNSIGSATVISLENEMYTLELELDEPVNQDLYPTITSSSITDTIYTYPYVSLSNDSTYEHFVLPIGKQLNK